MHRLSLAAEKLALCRGAQASRLAASLVVEHRLQAHGLQ